MGCPGNQRIAGGGVLLPQGVAPADFYSSIPPPNGGGFFLVPGPTPNSFDESSGNTRLIYLFKSAFIGHDKHQRGPAPDMIS